MTISLRWILIVALAVALGAIGWLAFVRSDPSPGTARGAAPAASAASRAVPAPTPAPAPVRQAPDVPFGTVRGSEPGTSATLLGLRRTGPKVVTARVQIDLDETAHGLWLPELEGEEGTWYTAEGMRLSDEFNDRELFPLTDDDGGCMCSRDIQRIAPGESIVVSAKFPAPPANVTHASLSVPGFSSFDGVPLGPLS